MLPLESSGLASLSSLSTSRLGSARNLLVRLLDPTLMVSGPLPTLFGALVQLAALLGLTCILLRALGRAAAAVPAWVPVLAGWRPPPCARPYA